MTEPVAPHRRVAAVGDGAHNVAARWRPTVATIDLDAIAHNVAALCRHVAPAEVCVVVKADGYGHGAVPISRAALRAGATWLGVALVEEAAALRAAAVTTRILLLSEAPPAALPTVIELGLTPTIYSLEHIHALEAAARAVRPARPAPSVNPIAAPAIAVHLKVDTGMHRVGCRPEDALALAQAILASPHLALEGVSTHLAVADNVEDPYTAAQLSIFEGVLDDLAAHGIDPGIVHTANSAGAIGHPAARRTMVRVGISAYGLDPDLRFHASGHGVALRPALSLTSEVSHVQQLPAGSRLSYGLIYELVKESRIATVPIGYADGVPRRLSSVGGEVLIRGRRHPIAGRVTMDQILVDVGDLPVERGDEVVLIGRQGEETLGAWDWAVRLDTIAYEITCAISGRVPRRYKTTT